MKIEDLYTGVGYVKFTYPDSSVRLIRTTLSDQLLESVLKNRPEDHLYDLDKKRWIKIPDESETKMEVFKDKPDVGGLNEFINRFI